jgi:hypothetical protein
MNTPLFTALLMLCGLGAVSFGATANVRRETLPALAAAFGIAIAGVSQELLPDARWIGGTAAAVAALHIFRPSIRWIGPVYGGILAGVLGVLLQAQGVSVIIAVPLAVAALSVSAYLSDRRSEFAPETLRQEAMLATMILGLTVAVIPGVMAGWQSAIALNREQTDSSNQIIATWVLVLGASSMMLGGLYSLLRRR